MIILKSPKNALEYTNLVLLHSNHQHVSATEGGEHKNTTALVMCQNHSTVKNHTILVKLHGLIVSYR